MLNIQALSFLLILGFIKTKYTQIMCINTNDDKGAFKYYVIALGGVGGPDSIADDDDALRGVVEGPEPK